MARLARVVLPGVVHHVTQRGVRSMDIFFEKNDQTHYLDLLQEQTEKVGLEIIGYCLMSNHVHFLVIPQHENSLRKAFGEAHRLYTRYVNFREKIRGYLFQGRFFSCPLDNQHLLAAARYVEQNPVRAKICERAEEYPWSSASFHTGKKQKDRLIEQRHPVYGTPKEWKQWLEQPENQIDLLRKSFKIGRPLGSEAFLKQAEETTGRTLVHQKPGPKMKR